MEQQNAQRVGPTEISKNIDDYEFSCDTVNISAELRVKSKKTGKVIFVTEVSSIAHDGTMNSEYAEKFFADVSQGAKLAFVRQATRKMNTLKVDPERIQDGGESKT